MMPREATVELMQVGTALAVTLSRAAVDYPDLNQLSPIEGEHIQGLPPLTNLENVIAYGTRLTKGLEAHDGLKQELGQLFLTPGDDEAKLHILIRTPAAEAYRWETLCANDKFLAVDVGCSVRRITGNPSGPSEPMRLFNWPLKLTAFLSAAGVKAAKELEAICKALERAKANGVKIEATIYLGEQDLLDAPPPLPAPDLKLRPMPSNPIEIDGVLQADPPHLLHFFCHGVVAISEQLLELATINDHDTGAANGSVTLSISRLRQRLAAEKTVWMTVLNSCHGAEHAPRVLSMAAALARDASPISIGMAEEIAEDDATLFSTLFYPDVFDLLKDAIGDLALGEDSIVDLGPATFRTRRKLHDLCRQGPQERFGRWCMPILYHRSQALRVARTDHPEWTHAIESVTKALRGLPPSMPKGARRALLDQLAAVPEMWRPDLYGNFA